LLRSLCFSSRKTWSINRNDPQPARQGEQSQHVRAWKSALTQDEIIKVGDLVHVMADNCDLGLGLVVMIETDLSCAYRVLTIDGRCLFYHPFELSLITS
jgi:hypothetical protein